MLINLRSWKLAKTFTEDSKSILKVLDLTERSLTLFKHYKPIKAILLEISNQKVILESHLLTAKKILDKKEVK